MYQILVKQSRIGATAAERAPGLQKTIRILEQIMSTDKYPRIFSRHLEAIVYISAGLDNVIGHIIEAGIRNGAIVRALTSQ